MKMRLRGAGSGQLPSISDVSLDVRECVRLPLANSCSWDCIDSDRFSELSSPAMTIFDCSLSVNGVSAFASPLLVPRNKFVSIMFGDDTWKFCRINCGRLNTPSSTSTPLSFATFCSLSSGIEFWLGGRGAMRFLRHGTDGNAFVRNVESGPDESVEFSELVELYGEADIVCGRWWFWLINVNR